MIAKRLLLGAALLALAGSGERREDVYMQAGTPCPASSGLTRLTEIRCG
jgi:hypothetical protein